MDKYNSKTSFRKWVSSVNLKNLHEELPSYSEFDHAFLDPRLCKEIGIDSLCPACCPTKALK